MKNRLLIIILLFWSVMAIQCANAQTSNTEDLDVAAFNSFKKESTYHLIDVRTPNEFSEGTIEGAKNLDYFSPDFKSEIAKLDKALPIYVFCRSGGRSAKAAKILSETGFSKVYNLKGGYLAWSNKNN